MKFCLISGKSGDDVKDIFIEEAGKIFDEVLYVPYNFVLTCAGKTPKLDTDASHLEELALYFRENEIDNDNFVLYFGVFTGSCLLEELNAVFNALFVFTIDTK